MDYGQASFTVATSLTPHVKKHEQEIEALKRRVAELEELVTKLLNKDGSI
jgi:cell division protein FtsB